MFVRIIYHISKHVCLNRHSQTQCDLLNKFFRKLSKFETIENIWRNRPLTIFGKNLLINSVQNSLCSFNAQIDIPPKYPKLSIFRVQATTVLTQQRPRPRLSIAHVERTTVLPKQPSKPKLTVAHVQTTTVPPQPKPKLSSVQVQTTTVLPQPTPMSQFPNKHFKMKPG